MKNLHIVKKGHFELEGNHLVILNPLIAKRVNKALNRYPENYEFQEGEEPLFRINNDEEAKLLEPILYLKLI